MGIKELMNFSYPQDILPVTMTQSKKPNHQSDRSKPIAVHPNSWLMRILAKADGIFGSNLGQQNEENSRPGLVRKVSCKQAPSFSQPAGFRRRYSKLKQKVNFKSIKVAKLQKTHPNQDQNHVARTSRSVNFYQNAVIAASKQDLPHVRQIDELTEYQSTILKDKHCAKDVDTRQCRPGFNDVQRERIHDETESLSSTIFDGVISKELESRWILNLSLHYQEKSNCEKFFVTFAEKPTHWKRVTITVDYSEAPEGSLEDKLKSLDFQGDKIARIYEVIRESLSDIKFYETVTNLKLQTKNNQLHVHVVEDYSEIIPYPKVATINHLNCQRVQEDELVFEAHISGFVYKVQYQGQSYVKKEIPGPDSIDEFLYEINALKMLSNSRNIIRLEGVVLDNKRECVKGLLISFAEKGALIDVIYDGNGQIPWPRRERWARQILQGLVDIHEAGYVQGDFTLSSIVIDSEDNAKIIDINRRGCPAGWEPPEVAALVAKKQPISMFIGVKSDLYQLGMVLYALALQEDEPEKRRPFNFDVFPESVPVYFMNICLSCLSEQPKYRSQASYLLSLLPKTQSSHSASSAKKSEGSETFPKERNLTDPNKTNLPKTSATHPRDSDWINSYDSEITEILDDQDYFSHNGISHPGITWRQKLYNDVIPRPEYFRSNSAQKPAINYFLEIAQRESIHQEPLPLATVSRPTTASFECSDLSGMDTVFEVPTEAEDDFTIHTMHNDDEFVKI